ncbi:hypothetical protein A7K73_01870 [Candidatus Methylacidiphilum fumarolicum]|nr:hypothetical protein A7K73_01870 [Candidatus Methylacidiphilum fumarolicum]TFE77534.1 hypothetical protein A7D33_03940 [Candidatus Methylacidiphilum fumarolicum]
MEWAIPGMWLSGHRDVVGGVNRHPLAFGQVVSYPTRIMYLLPSPLPGLVAGVNNRQAGSRCSLDMDQSCLAAAQPQAPSVPRRVPHEDAHKPCILARNSSALVGVTIWSCRSIKFVEILPPFRGRLP